MQNVTTILTDLIKIRTDNPTKPNTEIVNYICDKLQRAGVLFQTVPNETDNNTNIIAGINTNQLHDVNAVIAISGHMDTVGVTESEWTFPPYSGQISNDIIYGRGTVDMKQSIAVTLSILDELRQYDQPIILLFSSDEETNVNGIRQLTKFMQKNNIRAQYALIGEPTNMRLCVGNRGYLGYRTTIYGRAAHSSTPANGINAAYIASHFISMIEQLTKTFEPNGATLNTGIVCGGTGRNIIPSVVNIDWEIRYNRQNTAQQITQDIKNKAADLLRQYPGARIETQTAENLPAFENSDNTYLTTTAQEILHTDTFTMPIGTEAGFLQSMGIQTLVCGPGDDKLAHTSNEHIAISDLCKYQDFLLHLIPKLSN